MRTLTGTLLLSLACARQAEVPSTVGPSRGVRELAAADAELSTIAIVAARSLHPGGDERLKLAGIFVAGRELVALTDTVARAVNAERVEDDSRTKVPFVIGRCDAMAGCPQTRPVRETPVHALSMFRVVQDSAYVGGTARTGDGTRAICIVLIRAGGAWIAAGQTNVRSAQRCGQ